MKSVLRIFVAGHCPNCTEARDIASALGRIYPELGVEVIDIDRPGVVVPELVFATPTYVLNDRIVSLGTPSMAELASWIEEVINGGRAKNQLPANG